MLELFRGKSAISEHDVSKLLTSAARTQEIIGYQWKCIECNHDVSLCFKCFRYGHGGPGHASEDSLEEIGPNFVEVVVEPSIKGDDE